VVAHKGLPHADGGKPRISDAKLLQYQAYIH
jgi:hypothetical protein